MRKLFNLRILVVLFCLIIAGLVFADGTAETVEKSVGFFGKIQIWATTIFSLLGGGVVTAIFTYLSKKFNAAKYAKIAAKWLNLAETAVSMFEDNQITKEELASVKKAYNDALSKATNSELNHKELAEATEKLQNSITGFRRSA